MSGIDGRINGLILVAALAVAAPAGAGSSPGVQLDSMRCGRHVVEIGDQSYHLVDKCGHPDFRQVVSVNTLADERSVRGGDRRIRFHDAVTVVTESWVYRHGRGRIPRVLTITGGVLTDIRLAGR